MSPRMGTENTSRMSRDLRIRLGREVYETAHMMSEMRKWRPRIARCASCSRASDSKMTSSTRMQTSRLSPAAWISSCWRSSLSIMSDPHSGKNPVLGHDPLQHGVARGAPDEGENQVKLGSHPIQEIDLRAALPLLAPSDQACHEGFAFYEPVGVPTGE